MVYISPGNMRMAIPTFSLPAGITCFNATELCKKYCYAKKAEKSYRGVLPSRMRNLKHSRVGRFLSLLFYEDTFVMDMIKQIGKMDIKHFRIHESGDFYNQEYLNKWFDICRVFPKINFIVYTQMYNLDWKRKPKNMIRYWSAWPDSGYLPKNGLKARVIDNGKGIIKWKEKPTGHLCKKGRGSKITCDKCLWCLEGKGDVVFKIH